ncbi:MAG: ATP-dependent Clp protease ATP-binding subunit, partial [Candidatus Berkelbacteria bacterium]|nr:ATP-dependent Clp protease ATP-binding subunit [Candidatus Berkelbacteria bacterium]
LLSLLENKDTLAFEILTGFEIKAEQINLISSLISHKPAPSDKSASLDAKRSIQLAVHYASKYNHLSVGSEHLLLALISSKNFNSYLIIERIGIDPKKIKRQIESIFKGISRSFSKDESGNLPNASIPIMPENQFAEEGFDDLNFLGGPNGMPPFTQTATPPRKESVLESYSTNLTKQAEDGKLDPVIGRETEIARVIQTLCRRTKNNPILVGEPGVGKTAIVEGLAQRLSSGHVPAKLTGAEIYSLDLGSILAGTMYRGQFESRIKKIIAEIEKRPNIILFVDEIHTMVGAGSTEGSIDAANLLKPMLAKGTLRMVGSTTFDEYKKHIEKDPAFERRFQPVYVYAPTVEQTVEILQGLKPYYEKFHNVIYETEAIRAAAELSERFIHDRSLPDKAIDLIDEAGAAKNSKIEVKDKTTPLKKDLVALNRRKEALISAEKYEEAAKLREKELQIESTLKALQSEKSTLPAKIVSANDIGAMVSDWTGVPTSTMTAGEKKNYLNLEKRLKNYIIGQDEAVAELAKAIKRSRVGISNPARPIGSFIFLGPTGVGKTESAKVLAKEVFGSVDALIKIDMSEFMEKHNVARLIGAPAGYVGYEEGGRLTEKIRKNPYSVILFDEIEKAHPEVFNILLQIMEDGVLSDAKGRKVDFKNTIIIMTSNLGTDVLRRQPSIGFNNAADKKAVHERLTDSVMETVEKTFRPEFINRLDKTIVFYPLSDASLRKIVDLQSQELIDRLKQQDLELEISLTLRTWIAKKSYKPEFGARPIRKFIADHLENLLSDSLLLEKYPKGSTIKMSITEDRITLN